MVQMKFEILKILEHPTENFFIYICIVCINCNWECGTLYLIEIINFYISDPFWCGLVGIFTFYVYNCVSDDESSMYSQIFKTVLADFQLRQAVQTTKNDSYYVHSLIYMHRNIFLSKYNDWHTNKCNLSLRFDHILAEFFLVFKMSTRCS